MKTIRLTAVLLIIAVLSVFSVSATSDCEKINWHYKTNGSNTRPNILSGKQIEGLENALYIGNVDDKTIYLTFDAGYSNENVEKTLDVLKSHDIKAAFFILPGIIKNSEDVVRRMADEGHLVCNHTASHGDMSKITDIADFKNELNRLETLYYDTYGLEMAKYFRPPEGSFSAKTLEFCEELGYTPVFWSFAYADWDNNKQPNPEKAKEKIFSQLHDGMVMLLHPTSKTNADILDDVITEFKSRGYTFGTLDELASKTKQ
ncbi:MAG: polysaccharide deacetylase family protein [Clostridia bacterium]|nr:polysaccharide deacetylase family protein [Clostridia bacterium]